MYFLNSYIIISIIFLYLLQNNCYLCFRKNSFFVKNFQNLKQHPVRGYPGEPVFITPYIESGDISKGQNESYVKSLLGNIKSYAGYITVNKTYNSNLFFWFFTSKKGDWKKTKTILWLQGGPGVSSLFGLFSENGPYYIDEKGGLQLRNISWNDEFNLLYIDNPVGTGYSFTQDLKGYAKDQYQISRELYVALIQFFQLFPEIRGNEFYLTGESYAGKYIPSLAYEIYKKNPEAKIKINLKGLGIGNGFTDPENMLVYGSYLFELGIIDRKTCQKIQILEEDIRVNIRSGKYEQALMIWDDILEIVANVGFQNPYDYSDAENDYELNLISEFVQKDYVRKAIHVGWFKFNGFEDVYRNMRDDMLRTVAHLLPELLKNFKILFYNGQFDIICAYPLTVNFLENLSWDGAYGYYQADRNVWRVNKKLAGYWKSYGNLTEILVRNAGHLVPMNQPEWAYSMIKSFISGEFKSSSV